MGGFSQQGFISLWVAALLPNLAGYVLIGKKIFKIAEVTDLSFGKSVVT